MSAVAIATPGTGARMRPALVDRPGGQLLLGTAGVLVAVAVWEVAVAVGVLPARYVPPATDILVEVERLLGSGSLWGPVLRTLTEAGIGLGVALLVAVPVGTLMGLSPLADNALRPTVEFLRPVPGIALLPLGVLVWGQSMTTSWALVAFGCVGPMIVQSLYGARALDEVALDTARSFRLRRRDFVRCVIVPGSLPYLATGLRITASIALVVAVSAELLIGSPGLGHAIVMAQDSGRYAEMYALIAVTGLLGLAVQLGFGRLERHFLRWHRSRRGAA